MQTPGKETDARLPVHEVVVYSDRARVVRSGDIVLRSANERVRLGVLPARALPDSVRLEAEGARVVRVEVQRAEREALPRTEAQQLLQELETARDAELALAERRGVVERELAFLRALRPSAPPADPKLGPVPLETAGWREAISFLAARDASAGSALAQLDEELREQRQKLEKLRGRAQLLAAGATGEPGYRVEAVLEGEGTARLRLSYLSMGARWYPSYDVRYAPGGAEVELAFAGLVSQETGEDWSESRLILSTAVPATTATLPKLLAWKIGERDQFIPTPIAKPEPRRPAVPAPQPRAADGVDEEDSLRSRLLAAAQEGPATGGEPLDANPPPPLPMMAPSAPHAPPMRRPAPPPTRQAPRERKAVPAAPSMAPAMDYDMAGEAAIASRSSDEAMSLPAASSVSFGGQRSYRPPVFEPNLPASLAGGYDFTYLSARPETVRSGGEARRVALHSARLPATPLLVVFPALSNQAYLVSDVVNSSGRPLFQGGANLYVGADLQGQAQLPTTAVGEKWTVPLGVDDAIQVVRNVRLLTGEQGFFSKEGVNSYEVSIELLNPRPRAIEARIVDQIPLAGDQRVEVRLDQASPAVVKHDVAEGTLEWRLPLTPKQKRVVSFRFTVTYPKGAKLRQW